MDQLWKRKSTEKTLVHDQAHPSSRYQVEKALELLTVKTERERDIEILNEKLYSALSECNAKDNIAKKQVKIAEEAIGGWEKAETEAIYLRQELDKVLQQKAASEERVGHLDAALKECMQRLRFVRQEQENNVNVGNTQLIRALSGKDKLIEELTKYKTRVESDFSSLMLRLESVEKENVSLKYKVRVLEKELDIRNEERELNRRTSDVAQKQNDEYLKKIVKLETECQRLRLLVKKRLPGPTKMKNEMEVLRKEQLETRRKSSPFPIRGHATAEQAPSDMESDDKASCSGSWASALLSELEHFKNEKQLGMSTYVSMGNSEMDLMDDFAEMEKLAVVTIDYPTGSSHHSSEDGNIINVPNTRNSDQKSGPDLSIPVLKILELLEGINIPSEENGYIVRVFQWKTTDLSVILQQFVETCNDLLNGTDNFEHFAQEVASKLEWVMNHCFSLQDVSSMKEEMRHCLYYDESENESEEECGLANNFAESKDKTENHMEKQKTTREDNETQIMEMENRNNSCQQSDETHNDLKIQQESTSSNGASDYGKHREKELKNDWEINAASKKLAECQETILNLGKQLKALASPSDAALFDKAIPTPRGDLSRRPSLLEKMLAEDNNRTISSLKGNAPNGDSNCGASTNATMESWDKFNNSNNTSRTIVASMDIVPCNKKESRSFFKRLFWRRKKGTTLSF